MNVHFLIDFLIAFTENITTDSNTLFQYMYV